jgi:hypothetical protein
MHLPELDVIGVRLTAVFTARRPPTPVVFTALADIVIAIAIAIDTKSRSAGRDPFASIRDRRRRCPRRQPESRLKTKPYTLFTHT